MKTYWKDIVNDLNQWAYLEITVAETPKLGYHIQSGGQKRFKLTNNENTIFWGCIEHDYQGVWFLRNEHFWETKRMFIPPINSTKIEKSKSIHKNEYLSFWSKYFSKSLLESECTFLKKGVWVISEAKLKKDSSEQNDRFDQWVVKNIDLTFKTDQLSNIDWSFSGNSPLIPLKKAPQETEGRLKWWIKNVKEGICPPLLSWYVNSLDAYVLIDGHYRLQACLHENKSPTILVLNQVIEKPLKKDESVKEKILEGIELRQRNQAKEKLNINEVNNLLMYVYDDRPKLHPITKSIGKFDFEELWVNEVSRFKNKTGVDIEDLNTMIEQK